VVAFVFVLAPLTASAQVVEIIRDARTTEQWNFAKEIILKGPGDSARSKAAIRAVRAKGSSAKTVCSAKRGLQTAERSYFDVASGVLQPSLQLVRLCIGEAGRFRIPLYLVGGGASGLWSADGARAALVQLLNPTGGSLNLGVNDAFILGSYWDQFDATKLLFQYHAAIKYVNGVDTTGHVHVATTSLSSDLGVRFQTPVTDLDRPEEVGVIWAQARLIGVANEHGKQEAIFGAGAPASLVGFAADAGFSLGAINAKLSYGYSFTKLPGQPRESFKVGLDLSPRRPRPAGSDSARTRSP
jgi:hypothetical protein